MAPPIHAIVRATADHYGIDVMRIVERGRAGAITLQRQVAHYLAIEMTDHSSACVARAVERDRTTVLDSCRRVEALAAVNEALAADIAAIRAAIEARP